MNFEALATECRSAAFRESLVASLVWMQAAETIQDSMQQLKHQIKSPVPSKPFETSSHSVDSEVENNDGLGYTFRLDGNTPAAESLQHDFAPPKPIVWNRAQVSKQLEAVTTVFRFLRNACAACTANQNACQDAGLLEQAHDVVMHCCHWTDVEEEPIRAQIVLLTQVALQFCVNGVTSNANNQAIVWKLYFFDDFQKILVECHQYRKVVAFAVAVILNCVNSNSTDDLDIEEAATRRTDLVCARNLINAILHRCITKPLHSSSSNTVETSGLQLDDEDPAFEWICTLFGVLFQKNCANNLYNAVGAHMLSKLWSRVTPEQLIVLRLFRMWAISTLNPSFGIEIQEKPCRQQHVPAGTFEFVKNTWIYIVTENDDDPPIEGDEMRKKMWMELENEAKLMLLDVLGELTVDHTWTCIDKARDLLLSLLRELQRVWKLGRTHPSAGNRLDMRSAMPLTNGERHGYRSALIRVIGNLCFRQSNYQDLVREEGYLSLFLNHCNVDETNPLIREWSLVALRNLCEGNEANQRYIETLRPQGMDAGSKVVLKKAKLHAHIGEKDKIKLIREETQVANVSIL